MTNMTKCYHTVSCRLTQANRLVVQAKINIKQFSVIQSNAI